MRITKYEARMEIIAQCGDGYEGTILRFVYPKKKKNIVAVVVERSKEFGIECKVSALYIVYKSKLGVLVKEIESVGYLCRADKFIKIYYLSASENDMRIEFKLPNSRNIYSSEEIFLLEELDQELQEQLKEGG